MSISRWSFIFIYFTFFFFQCSSLKVGGEEKLIGGYLYQPNGAYLVSSNIVLNANHSFKYTWLHGLNAGVTLGKWEKQGDKLILNSVNQQGNNPTYKVTELSDKDQEGFEIKIIDKTGETLPFVTGIMKKDTVFLSGAYSDMDGALKLKNHPEATHLAITYLGYHDVNFSLKDLKKSFTLEMILIDQNKRYFKNEEWEINDGHLYNPNLKRKYLLQQSSTK